MPAKRKATATAPSEQAPPTKRVTRSRGPLVETQPLSSLPTRAHRLRRAPSAKAQEDDTKSGSVEEVEGKGEKARTRNPRGKRRLPLSMEPGDITESSDSSDSSDALPLTLRSARRGPPNKYHQSTRSVDASSSRVTIESLQVTTDAENSPDELLLQSPKMNPIRPTTPVRTLGSRLNGTPRLVLDAVEIATPSRSLRNTPSVARSLPKPPDARDGTPGTVSSLVDRPPLTGPGTPFPGWRQASPTRPTEAELEEPPKPPAKPAHTTPFSSPRKVKAISTPQASPGRLPRVLPAHLHASLSEQKRTALRALSSIAIPQSEEHSITKSTKTTNETAFQQLGSLLAGTINRGEGNSCLIIGPRGSGKTQMIEQAISEFSDRPIVIRLSGYAQTNDRLAMREIAWQLAEQTGQSLLPDGDNDDADDDDNPFVDQPEPLIFLPPPAHLLALISMIPALPRPTVLVLDAFDLFALHARQALLYCLLDTAQSCRVGQGRNGLAVIGVTTRVDTINMLEKRVKSRFSGRTLRTACPRTLDEWICAAKTALCTPIRPKQDKDSEWSALWENSVSLFFEDRDTVETLRETFSLSRDARLLNRILIQPILGLKPASPFLTPSSLRDSVRVQRCPPRFACLSALHYPSICLLIASMHARISGHDTFTFEMLHEAFRDQVRTSLSAPVQVEGGGIGMVRCSRDVMFRAFETLVTQRVFVAAAPSPSGTGREFVKYRCAVDRSDVKKAVEKMGQLNLRKWFSKAQ